MKAINLTCAALLILTPIERNQPNVSAITSFEYSALNISGTKNQISEACAAIIQSKKSQCDAQCAASNSTAYFEPGICGVRSTCSCVAKTHEELEP